MTLVHRCARLLSTRSGGGPSDKLAALGMSLDAAAHSEQVVVDGVGAGSFTVSGVRVQGALLLLPHLATLWNVDNARGITPGALTLLKLHHPRPDMLLLGTGDAVRRVDPDVEAFMREIDVRLAVYDTLNAAHAFNVLNAEGRRVAAALLPAGDAVHRRTSRST